MAINSTDENEFDLEAMSQEDSSWHPCQVSLCTTGVLLINFEDHGLSNVMLAREEALNQLRFRSKSLQGHDCSDIKEGEHVLANSASRSESLFFDAKVEKINRVRHSKRVQCRCGFMIKWLDQGGNNDLLTVPVLSLLKLSVKCIKDHPTVVAFLSSVKNLTCGTSPFPADLEDPDGESNIHIFLDKQVKKIGCTTDMPNRNAVEDVLPGLQGNAEENSLSRSDGKLSASILSLQACHMQNQLNMSTKDGNKLDLDLKTADAQPCASPIPMNPMDNRTCLSPLASRAALASIRSNLNRKDVICSENISVQDHDATRELEETTRANALKIVSTNNDVRDVEVAALFEEPIAMLVPVEGLPKRQQDVKSHNGTMGNERKGTKRPAVADSFESWTPFSVARTNDNGQSMSSAVKRKAHPISNVRRSTRKAAREENKDSTATELEVNGSAKKSDMFDSFDSLTPSAAARKKQPVQVTASGVAGNTEKRNDNCESKTSAVKQKSHPISNVRRSTRKAVREDDKSSTPTELEVNGSAQKIESQPGIVCNRITRKKTRSGPALEIQSSQVQEANKKQKVSSLTKGENSDAIRSSELKRSSKKQKPRFSFRLHFLPRTRSQNKSKLH